MVKRFLEADSSATDKSETALIYRIESSLGSRGTIICKQTVPQKAFPLEMGSLI